VTVASRSLSPLRLAWYAFCFTLGIAECFLSAELVGLVLLIPTLMILVSVARRRRMMAPTLFVFAGGFECVAVVLTLSVFFPSPLGTLNSKLFGVVLSAVLLAIGVAIALIPIFTKAERPPS
jgi:uncharacterized membrane protein YczE